MDFFLNFACVKAIRFIFALYVLFLAVYPCSDSQTSVDERKTGFAFVDAADYQHATDEQDSCTPFCICSCCAAHIRLALTPEIDFSNLLDNTNLNSFYFERPFLNNSQSVWQPPRI